MNRHTPLPDTPLDATAKAMIVEDDGDEWTDTDDPEEPLQTAKKQTDRQRQSYQECRQMLCY